MLANLGRLLFAAACAEIWNDLEQRALERATSVGEFMDVPVQDAASAKFYQIATWSCAFGTIRAHVLVFGAVLMTQRLHGHTAGDCKPHRQSK